MSSGASLARSVDALQALVAQLTERISFLEGRVAALERERAESSWDAVSEAPPSSAPFPVDTTHPSSSAPPSAPAAAPFLLGPRLGPSLCTARAPVSPFLLPRSILRTLWAAEC